jgi:hypothetical protein
VKSKDWLPASTSETLTPQSVFKTKCLQSGPCQSSEILREIIWDMSSLADVDCFLKRSARSVTSVSSPRGFLTDLLASPSSGYGSSSGYGHSTGYGHSGGYSSYHECCPLVVDPKTLCTLLALGAAATYLLQLTSFQCILQTKRITDWLLFCHYRCCW